jgi:SAM-dependent methyltransferase
VDDSVTAFYNQLAGEYHLLFADWDQSVRRQAEILDRLIAAQLGPAPQRVLDCSCGIGTQAIGLAGRGYAVHGTDLSAAAVERAAREAARLGVQLTTGVADLRHLETVEGSFDVVLTCDNALPHLLTDDDLHQAARGMLEKLRPGGLLVASIRDYDRLLAERPRTDAPRLFDTPAGRRIVFQVWDWHPDAPRYTVQHWIVRETDGAWQTSQISTVYRAIRRDELGTILAEAGFREVTWLQPDASGYYQPIVTAHR